MALSTVSDFTSSQSVSYVDTAKIGTFASRRGAVRAAMIPVSAATHATRRSEISSGAHHARSSLSLRHSRSAPLPRRCRIRTGAGPRR